MFSGAVVGAGGGDFVFEKADKDTFAVCVDADVPGFFFFSPGEAFIFRAGWGFEFSAVSNVLCEGGRPEIGLAIVEAVMIDVVAE